MTEATRKESTWVAGVLARDQSSLEEVYRSYEGAVRSIAKRVLNDGSLAEDIVQEVFVSFWNNPSGFDPGRGSLRTYLLTIAHRRAVDTVRSEVARSQREEKTPPQPPGPDLESEVWQRSQSELVQQAVAALGEDERRAISLAYFGGLSYVEVAASLGEPEGTVKSRIRSGMRKLSASLAEVAS